LDGVGGIVGIEHDAHTREAGHRKLEKIELLADQDVVAKVPRSGYISARLCEALRKPCYNRIFRDNCDDRNCPRYRVRSQGTGGRTGNHDVRIERDKFLGKRRHAFG